MPRWPRNLPFYEGVCQHLTFNKMPLAMPEVDSDDEEYLQTVELDDQHGLRSLYWIAGSTYVSMRYPGQQPHPCIPVKECQQPHPATWSNRDAPRPWGYGTWHPRWYTRLYRCSGGNNIRLECLGTKCAGLSMVEWQFIYIRDINKQCILGQLLLLLILTKQILINNHCYNYVCKYQHVYNACHFYFWYS